MTEHTKTPWSLHDRWLMSSAGPVPLAIGYQDWVTAPNGPRYEEWKANAAFIIKAANSHDALVEALQFIADGYDNHDVNHVDYRVKVYQVALDALASVGSVEHG